MPAGYRSTAGSQIRPEAGTDTRDFPEYDCVGEEAGCALNRRFAEQELAYRTANRRHSSGTPLSARSPRSSNSRPEPTARSLTVLDTSTSLGDASASTR